MVKQRIRITYNDRTGTYGISDDMGMRTGITASQMLKSLRQYPRDTLVNFENVSRSVKGQVLDKIRHY